MQSRAPKSTVKTCRHALLGLMVTLPLFTVTPALAQSAATLPVTALTQEKELAALVWRQNPDVRQAWLAEGQAQADLKRNRQWSNPTVDVGQVSLPTGIPPQPDGTDLLHGPAQSLGVTQPLEFARRGLRIDRAGVAVTVAHLQTLDTHKQRTADLMAVVVRLAAGQMRVRLFQEQIDVLRELVQVTQLTVQQGFAPPLDYEKLLLEQGRVETLADQAHVTLSQAQNDWSSLTLTPAPNMRPDDAERIIDRYARLPLKWPDREQTMAQIPQRRILQLQRQEADLDLQIAQKAWIPDLGLRVGYTFDTLPGNIPHTLAWSLNGPIPVFQAGQADIQDAESRHAIAENALANQMRTFGYSESSLRRRAELLASALISLQQDRLPAARATLSRLERALRARGIPMSDMIQMRRNYLDMEGIRVDLLEQLSSTLIDYRRLLAWQLPDPVTDPPKDRP